MNVHHACTPPGHQLHRARAVPPPFAGHACTAFRLLVTQRFRGIYATFPPLRAQPNPPKPQPSHLAHFPALPSPARQASPRGGLAPWISSLLPHTAPATMSEAPETNLVRECSTTWAPHLRGDTTMGAKVLSTTRASPWHKPAAGRRPGFHWLEGQRPCGIQKAAWIRCQTCIRAQGDRLRPPPFFAHKSYTHVPTSEPGPEPTSG